MRYARLLLLLIAVGLCASPSFCKPASQAVVVGVNHPNLLKAAPLEGCANDARAIQKVLERQGFKVTTLIDDQATRQNVLQALQRQGGGDSLVFYFAGYGTGPDNPRLLTADARESGGQVEGALGVSELDHLLTTLPYQHKTVILDAGFAPAHHPGKGLRSRYYAPTGSREVTVRVDDRDLPGISPEQIHYLTAGRYNEEALEGSCGGVQEGVFSFSLIKHSGDLDKPGQSQAVPVRVSSEVAERADDRQHPSFPNRWSGLGGPEEGAPLSDNDDFLARVGAEPAAAGVAAKTSLWNLFNLDYRDQGKVHLGMGPDRSPVKVGDYLTFDARVGANGYLVLVEHSVEDRLQLIYPRDGRVESARVKSGDVVHVPSPGEKVFAATPGRERLKAFLMSSEANARAFLTQLQGGGEGIGFHQAPQLLGSRSVDFVTESEYSQVPETRLGTVGVIREQAPFYTSDLSFEVVR